MPELYLVRRQNEFTCRNAKPTISLMSKEEKSQHFNANMFSSPRDKMTIYFTYYSLATLQIQVLPPKKSRLEEQTKGRKKY